MAKKILVVDDDQASAKLMASALNSSGFETQIAFTGEAGLELYRAQPPDLILLDVAMPGMSGFDVASTIRGLEQDSQRHTLIVIMTAHARSYQVSVDFHTGIDSYLIKPLLPDFVVAHVENLLSGGRADG